MSGAAAYPLGMTTPLLSSFQPLAQNYDALLCDAWGVIHNGRRLFDGVEDALVRFRQTRGPVVILTNAPKPSPVIRPQLDALGLSREAYDVVVTSGDVARAEINKCLPGRAYRIGWASDGPLYDGLDLGFAPLPDADFIICTGIADEGPSEPEDYREMLAPAAAADKLMICGNPDIVVNWRGELMWCAGAIARVYEDLGGRVVYAGKPYPEVYELAMAAIADRAGRTIAPDRILAVGDGAVTDIRGANRARIDALFIAGDGGVHEGGLENGAVERALKEADVAAVAAMRGLVW